MRVRELRRARKLTQVELAERADVSVRTISDMESGRRYRANEDTVERIARVLGVMPDEFDDRALNPKRLGARIARSRTSIGRRKAVALLLSLPEEDLAEALETLSELARERRRSN